MFKIIYLPTAAEWTGCSPHAKLWKSEEDARKFLNTETKHLFPWRLHLYEVIEVP